MPRHIESITSAARMQELGQQVGLKLRAGDVVLLRGDLGSGKTTFTQGVGRALGILELTSPTFVIAKIYPSAIPLVHVDAYRLIGKELAIFDDLDLESRIPVSITIIEWGSGFVERLSESFIEIDFQFGADPDERMVSITGLDR
jgi:tRNA threonylcarbamoyladenosine biosynthesis protein TsaE